jgi:hypothetical protein
MDGLSEMDAFMLYGLGFPQDGSDIHICVFGSGLSFLG